MHSAGLMPIDAFNLFDFDQEGSIGIAQFVEIVKTLGVRADVTGAME